jgi:Tfp pilus assembly protein PilV
VKTHISDTRRYERGFSIVEMLIATVIMMASLPRLSADESRARHVRRAAEVSDMQQRLRIAMETAKDC